jgi:hypothetical protein
LDMEPTISVSRNVFHDLTRRITRISLGSSPLALRHTLNLGSLHPAACVSSKWECFPSTKL